MRVLDDFKNSASPDIVRLEYAWEELLTQRPVDVEAPVWDESSLMADKVTSDSAELTFKTATDDNSVASYTIKLNGETVGTINFSSIKEEIFDLPGAKVNYTGQGTVYIAMPENIPEGMELPVVIAVHGSGRGALDYRDTAFYKEQRDIALEHGYIFASISNGSDTWGLDDGLYNINLLYDYLIENYPAQEKAALWATSAGGTLANRMVKDYPEKVRFVLGTFPVYDLNSGFSLSSCQSAWGTTDADTFAALIEGKNPADFPDALKNHDYYIAHGDADAAVPLAENAEKMRDDVGSNVHLQIIEGGVHGTANFSYYDGVVEQAFAEHPAVYIYTITGLETSSHYEVTVYATDAGGNCAASNTVSFETMGCSRYNFEEDTIGKAPAGFVLEGITAENTITVAADPANTDNQVMKLSDMLTTGNAVKATVSFAEQTGIVTVSFRVMFGEKTQYVINLMSDSISNLGPRFLAKNDGSLSYSNGSWVAFGTYELDVWYTVKIVADVSNNTYDLYFNDEEVAAGISFANTGLMNLNKLQFTTVGVQTGELYIDDVNVPESPAVQGLN